MTIPGYGAPAEDPQEDLRPEGAETLDAVLELFRKYLALPAEHHFTVLALWTAHTHAPADTFYVTPRLIIESAEPGSGKTRMLELLALLVASPEMTISATVAAIFRMLADKPYTLLFDEIDAIFNPKNGGNYEDLRALLNAGYKKGATIARCVGDAKSMKVQRFTVFAPVALAGLAGRTPQTISTRGITMTMRKRSRSEKVSPFRERDAEDEAKPLRDALSLWVESVADDLAEARPRMPKGVEDRPAEVWEALLAVAEQAGGDWPEKARKACEYFVLDSIPQQSLGVRLLRDLRDLFRPAPTDDNPCPPHFDHMATNDIVDALVKLEEAPWSDLYGKPLDYRRLSKELARYGVQPVQYKVDGKKHRGYVVAPTDNPVQCGLDDAWSRYLDDSGTAGTSGTPQARPVPTAEAVPHDSGTDSGTGTGTSSQVPPVPHVPQQSGDDRPLDLWRNSGKRVAS